MNTNARCPSFNGASGKGFWFRCSDAVSRRLWPLDCGTLCAEARRRSGFTDFEDPAIEQRLSVLVKSIEREADIHPLGRFLAWIHLCELLETRLLLEHIWKQSDDFETESIEHPIFITGMPRSGSTFLHELLTQDPANRAPLVWEVMSPLPAGTGRQIRRTAMSLWWFRRIARDADSVHPIRAASPHECVAIHSYTLLSREFATTFRVPTYEAFLDAVDFDPAYLWQKRFLQFLQWQRPAKRWVLKAPDHVFSLGALLRVFPDAFVIQMHRNPLEVVASSSRLVEVLQRTFARPQERHEIGIREARALAEGLDRISRFRENHPELADRFLDVNYAELVADPLNTVRRLFRQLDLRPTRTSLDRVRNLAANRTRYSGRQVRPSLSELGIDSGIVTRQFASYCARFGIRQG